VPSRETSRQNLAKAIANGRKPRLWRSLAESETIQRLVWQWYIDQGPRCSRRELARRLRISHTWVQKLVQEFAVYWPVPYLEGVFVDGRLQMPRDRYPLATFEQLRAAQEETWKMRDRGLLRGPRRWKIAEFKIGDNIVRALVPSKTYAAVLASNCVPLTVVPITTRRYVKGGRDYPPGIDKRGRLRLGDLKKSQASAITDERVAQ
jgi:hypothetical protein